MFLDSDPWTPAETWIRPKLSTTNLRWTRQATGRFWQFGLGIAIELDPSASGNADHAATDRAAFYHQGVIVVRVEEFNEAQADEALRAIQFSESWNARRRALGLPQIPAGEDQCDIHRKGAVAKVSRTGQARQGRATKCAVYSKRGDD